jgi:hypothetical protein
MSREPGTRMRRGGRLCLLLLPLLAACAGQPPQPRVDVPIPALSYAAALDGGKVTPIGQPIVVRYAPYPTASFEQLELTKATVGGETLLSTRRIAGTSFAEASGGLVSITFLFREASHSGDLASTRPDIAIVKGVTLSLEAAPYGPLTKATASLTLPGSPRDDMAVIERQFTAGFAGTGQLPAAGFRQNDGAPVVAVFPTEPGEETASFTGMGTVRGQGSYRGRPVVVLDFTGVVTRNERPMGVHAYAFIDTATGLLSHAESVGEGNFAINDHIVPMRLQCIEDIRF